MALYDDFNRANQAVEATGLWTQVGGNVDIVSNQAVNQTSAANSLERSTSTFAVDHEAQVNVAAAGDSGSGIGVCARLNTPGTDTYANAEFYVFFYNRGGGTWNLNKKTAGAGAVLAAQSASEPSFPYTITIRAVGQCIECLANGTRVFCYGDNAALAGTKVGFTSGNTGDAWDNFYAQNYSVGCGCEKPWNIGSIAI